MLHNISNDFLIDSYKKANSLGLDHYFIFLLEQELFKRDLSTI
ncbi:MAG TPA: sporulation histidine kinase inhibitor Sda [Niallia sp.]|nr:sporulation histidine kinase inhibitor Sda [Niallia sp.]HWK21575.1 sporulation histidine kinase inhibitor Sda [Ureibacillus sp.]